MTTRWRLRAWDLLLAAVVLGAALFVHATGYDAVPSNRPTSTLSFLLTISAILPLAVRRTFPLGALVACFPGLLLLMALDFPVGTAVLGIEVAFYTVAAWGTRRHARWGMLVVLAGVGATVLLDPVDLSAEGIAVNGAVLVGGWVLGTGTRARRDSHAVELLRAEAQAQAERDRAARATAEERLRITRELHDVLGHALSVMVVQAGVAEHLLDTRPAEAREAVAAITATGRASLTEMRRMLTVLREGDGLQDAGLPYDPVPRLGQLPALIQRVEAAGIGVTLTMTGLAGGPSPAGPSPAGPSPGEPSAGEPSSGRPSCGVPDGIELAAYRVVQEALTNCLKHSGARHADVRLVSTGEAVEVEVTDDGVGASDAAARAGDPARSGHGLIGMRERVSVYGGELATGPAQGGGFRVWARFPLDGAAAAP